MEKYTGLEALAIANAKFEIKKAKEKMAAINKQLKDRQDAASKAAAEARLWRLRNESATVMREHERKLDQLKIDKEDFDDRVRLFLSKVSRELKILDLRIIESDNYPLGGKIGIKDQKADQSTVVKVIAGKGYEWD